MTISEPMLAGTIKDLKDIRYPCLATRKLDGIRCLKIGGRALTRKFKPIPNHYLRQFIESNFPDGVDGELIMDGGSFQETTSAVMTEEGQPRDIVYYIFDYVKGDLDVPYDQRMIDLEGIIVNIPKTARVVLPFVVNNEAELLKYEQKCLSEGYEGVMLRSLNGPYKCGRSTVKEGYLLKLKRFEDAEAVVVGFEERMHNANEAKADAFGRIERSSHKANQVATGMLGALIVEKDGIQFKIGTGFTETQRIEFWKNPYSLIRKTVTFKFQPSGVKDAPRFPVFKGFRHENDLS